MRCRAPSHRKSKPSAATRFNYGAADIGAGLPDLPRLLRKLRICRNRSRRSRRPPRPRADRTDVIRRNRLARVMMVLISAVFLNFNNSDDAMLQIGIKNPSHVRETALGVSVTATQRPSELEYHAQIRTGSETGLRKRIHSRVTVVSRRARSRPLAVHLRRQLPRSVKGRRGHFLMIAEALVPG